MHAIFRRDAIRRLATSVLGHASVCADGETGFLGNPIPASPGFGHAKALDDLVRGLLTGPPEFRCINWDLGDASTDRDTKRLCMLWREHFLYDGAGSALGSV